MKKYCKKGGNIMVRDYSETLYSEIADWYDETRWEGKGEFIDLLQKELLYSVLEKCSIKKGDKILDIGAGTGRFVIPFAKKGYDAYGIDISEEMLQRAKNKAGDLPNLHLEKANAKNMPFSDNYFEFVTAYRVLVHIPDYEDAVKEIYRVLKPGGFALVEFNNKYSLSGLGKLLRQLRKMFGVAEETDAKIVSRYRLSKSFLNAGFEIEKIYHQFFISEVLYRYLPKQTLELLKRVDVILSNSIFGSIATRFIVLAKKPQIGD